MPLLEVQCSNGHLSEVLARGGAANNGPFACVECGEPAKRQWSTFGFNVNHTEYAAVEKDPDNRHGPEFIERMGGGMMARDENNLMRPALTHSTRCPKESRWRNVAIINDLNFAKRLCCEGCGYTWLYRGETAADPLLNEVKNEYRPGDNFSAMVPAGTGYDKPKRGA